MARKPERNHQAHVGSGLLTSPNEIDEPKTTIQTNIKH